MVPSHEDSVREALVDWSISLLPPASLAFIVAVTLLLLRFAIWGISGRACE